MRTDSKLSRDRNIVSRHHPVRTTRKLTQDKTIIVNNYVGSSRHRFEDRPHYSKWGHRNTHVFRDHHSRLCFQIIWPKYHVPIWYSSGGHVRYHYVYPYYTRRYMFVSLNGYWPTQYSYLRYYWYPTHYYSWYGYHPVAQRVQGDTYNYYTYNYYDNETSYVEPAPNAGGGFVDHNTFADIREKLALQEQQQEGPPPQDLADIFFEAAVKAFEQGNYQEAADRFDWALQQAPNDKIMPYAYAMALFADGQYDNSAASLRAVLTSIDPQQDGIIYPRGLYLEEETLLEQVDTLTEAAAQMPQNSNLQLLLGYHLLGLGNTDEAMPLLTAAAQNPMNKDAAVILLNLAQKIAAENIVQKNG